MKKLEEMEFECKKIFEHYGLPNQARQLAEECAELSIAGLKLARLHEDFPSGINSSGTIETVEFSRINNLIEEIADVMIMCEQFKQHYNIPTIEISSKIEEK